MLVTAAAGALGLATVDLAANALGAKVCRVEMTLGNLRHLCGKKTWDLEGGCGEGGCPFL